MVSVIIPCYNQGKYIEETLLSVINQTYKKIEIIVVNDGSNDIETTNVLKKLNSMYKFKLIETLNNGLAEARNIGIKEAKGIYILPLDSDDIILPKYIEKCVEILEKYEKVGIVYTLAFMFEGKKGPWFLPKFDDIRMLRENMIYCSGMYRAIDWEKTEGYQKNMIFGYEDWDFWIKILSLKREVYRIDEFYFKYRIRKNSMVRNMENTKLNLMKFQILKNNEDYYLKRINDYYKAISVKKIIIDKINDILERIKITIKFYFKSLY